MKPIATGCYRENGKLRNGDALSLQKESSLALPYEKINPYAFAPPASPHIAAKAAGITIDLSRIVFHYHELAELAECVLVEGIGGWETPLSDEYRLSDLARALNLPVILVIGLKLGCLNHALLTYASIRCKGAVCAGWIANQIDADMAYLPQNMATLDAALDAPMLGFIPFQTVAGPDQERPFRNNEFIRQYLGSLASK